MPFEVVGFGQSTASLWGEIRYATVGVDLQRLWGVFDLPDEPPTIDFPDHVVLLYNRVDDACPDSLESLQLVGDRLEPNFVPPDAACDLPALAFSYAVSIPRSSLPDEFAATLPAARGNIYPEQALDVDLTTIVTDAGEPLLMSCGRVVSAYRFMPPEPLPLDEEAENALEALGAIEEGRFFAETYDWGVWSHTESHLILLGDGPFDQGDASFTESTAGTWSPRGWGGCGWWAATTSQAVATWIIDSDAPPTTASTMLHLLATERACANGQPPGDRPVTHVVIESASTITVIVLVERIEGLATCPSNPPFEYSIELGAPLGDRDLIDGSSVPGQTQTP